MAEEMDEVQPEENEEFSSAVDFHIQRADELPEVLPDDIENRKVDIKEVKKLSLMPNNSLRPSSFMFGK